MIVKWHGTQRLRPITHTTIYTSHPLSYSNRIIWSLLQYTADLLWCISRIVGAYSTVGAYIALLVHRTVGAHNTLGAMHPWCITSLVYCTAWWHSEILTIFLSFQWKIILSYQNKSFFFTRDNISSTIAPITDIMYYIYVIYCYISIHNSWYSIPISR